jgi:hypothetical protein
VVESSPDTFISPNEAIATPSTTVHAPMARRTYLLFTTGSVLNAILRLLLQAKQVSALEKYSEPQMGHFVANPSGEYREGIHK